MDENFIVRKQGKGSFVSQAKHEEDLNRFVNYNLIPTFSGGKADHKILQFKLIHPSEEILNKLELSEGSKVFEIIRLRLYRGETGALDYTYIPEHIDHNIKDKMKLFKSRYIYEIFDTIPNILLGKSRIYLKPIIANEIQAKVLKIAIGTPILLWERITFSKEQKAIELSKFYACEDKCSYYIEFRK